MQSHTAALDDEQWLLHQSIPRAFPVDRDPFVRNCLAYGGGACVAFTFVLVGVFVCVLSYELHQASKLTVTTIAGNERDDLPVFCHLDVSRMLHDEGHYPIDRVPGNYCSHIVIPLRGLFAWTNETLNFDISFSAATALLETPRLELNRTHPHLKHLIAIGDETHSGRRLFARWATNSSIYANFMIDLVKWVTLNKLDGVVLHKVFPIDAKHRKQILRFLVSLKAVMDRKNLLFVVTVPQNAGVLHLDKKGSKLNRFLDYIAIVMQGPDQSVNSSDAILTPINAVEDTMTNVIKNGLSASKMLLTISLDGYLCTLEKPYEQGASVLWNETRTVRQLPYRDICKLLKNREGWTTGLDADSGRPFAFKGMHWLGYESEASVRKLASLVTKLGLGGVFVWDVTSDDFEGNCGRPNALVSTIFREVRLRPPLLASVNVTTAGNESASVVLDANLTNVALKDLLGPVTAAA